MCTWYVLGQPVYGVGRAWPAALPCLAEELGQELKAVDEARSGPDQEVRQHLIHLSGNQRRHGSPVRTRHDLVAVV